MIFSRYPLLADSHTHDNRQTPVNPLPRLPVLLIPIISLFEFIFNLFPLLFFPVIGNGIVNLQDHFRVGMAHPPAGRIDFDGGIPQESAERMTEGIRDDIEIDPFGKGSGFFFYPLILCFPVPPFLNPVYRGFHTEQIRLPRGFPGLDCDRLTVRGSDQIPFFAVQGLFQRREQRDPSVRLIRFHLP